MQERSFDGVWWLPSAPERTVGGRFSFRREVGPRLEILGELLTSYERAGATGKIPIVLGSIAGTEVTLLDVNVGRAHFSIGRRYSQQEYRAELAVVGAHLGSRDDLRSDHWEIQCGVRRLRDAIVIANCVRFVDGAAMGEQ